MMGIGGTSDPKERSMGAYSEAYRRSLAEPDAFWLAAAESISWTRPPRRALDDANPPFHRWFPDAELNTSYNALDRHVEAGRGGQAALIWDSPVTGRQRTYSYEELR
jgi:propionyl-CoA synthetase